jgi:hypothetical protein
VEILNEVILNGDSTGVSYDELLNVAQGDQIDFVINARSNWGYDSTYFQATITLTPGTS